MSEFGRFGWWRHAAAGVVVLGCSGLALAGLVGEERQTEERFEGKQVTVTPTGDDGVTVREVVDQDFGSSARHGYERIVPNDFGVPTGVRASSPDAPADVSVEPVGGATRIRVGDPDVSVSGQHRYMLTYTLPDARLSSGELALDIIGTDEALPTGRFEVVITGLQLDGARCHVGGPGAVGGCTLEPDGGVYRAEIGPLDPGEGITIGGTITGRADPVAVAAPPVPARRGGNHTQLAVAMLVVGVASVAAVYLIARRRGRNEVFGGGAADAAYGAAPTPGSPLPPRRSRAPGEVRLVADEQMDELATTEFAPPEGIAPWQGTVVLRERIDDESIGAWFSGLAARDVITLTRSSHGDVTLGVGEKLDSAPPEERDVLSTMFDWRQQIRLGSYDKRFATAWRKVGVAQKRAIARSRWWKRHPPGSAAGLDGLWQYLFVSAVSLLAVFGGALSALGWNDTPPAAVLLAVAVPAVAAFALYRCLLPVRSAPGSALALRAESFRRFLKASEGRHVEWAWQQGLLRQYSAWAVALGAADAWQQAMKGSGVPPAELSTGPLLIHSIGSSWTITYTPPSSSGSGGDGGSSGGGGFSSVGGGGGGGSSGSW